MNELPLNTVIFGESIETLKTFPDNSIDFVFTDPPYGHNNNDGVDLIARSSLFRGKEYIAGSKTAGRPILSDGIEANDLFRSILPELFRVLKPGSCCCCCCGGGGGPDPQFARWSLWMDEVFAFKQMVVWDKGPIGMGWHYRRSYETVLVGQKHGAACKWFDTSSRIENIIRHIPKIIPQKGQHPTEKPVCLPAHFIRLHTEPGHIVLDPFCGSGSTLIAAKGLERQFVGIELDPKWQRHATDRLDQDTETLPLLAVKEKEDRSREIEKLHTGKLWGNL